MSGLGVERPGQQEREGDDLARPLRREALQHPGHRRRGVELQERRLHPQSRPLGADPLGERVHGRGVPRVAAAVGDDEESGMRHGEAQFLTRRPRLRSTHRSSGLKMSRSMAMPTNRMSRIDRKIPGMSKLLRPFSSN
ncbi:hypothetical protein SBADM41S_08966 [Streptomyces badius]